MTAGPMATSPRLGPNYRRLFVASTVSNLGDGVGLIAYPWLASAVTRNPVLIALVAVAQRLPWLLFTLPAGVITDRNDRRRIMVGANAARAVLTLVVALAVLWRAGALPGPDELDDVISTEWVLYACVLVATMLLGVGEVLYDNSAQTFMPRIVANDDLEKANGRLWASETAANQFLGPPLGSLMLATGFALPFFIDAGSFAVSAALIMAIAATPQMSAKTERQPWKVELREGIRWLWHHELLRPMAIILGLLNGLGAVTFAVFVLFAQDVLGTSTTEFAVLTMAGAVGGILGGWTASWIAKRLGSGPSLWVTLIGGAVTSTVIGLVSNVPAVAAMFAITTFVAVLWNVITVSLRQSIIPDHLLGRVNSVYRFFAWGMIPIGSLIGGLVVAVIDVFASRELALRMPWFVAAVGQVIVFVYAAPKLTTARMDAARAAAAGTDEPVGVSG
jgi:MFS family permease